jgi:hypothetical protein
VIEHPEFRRRRPTQTFGVDRAHDTLGLWTGLGLFCLYADRAITVTRCMKTSADSRAGI